jgi:hypothetical protein
MKSMNAFLMTIIMIMAPLTGMNIITAQSGSADAPIASQDALIDYGGRERDLTFLLHSVNGSETSKNVVGRNVNYYMDTTLEFNGTTVVKKVTSSSTYTWYLVPALAGDVNVTHFDFKMWIWATSSSGTPQGNLTAKVYEVTTTTWTQIASATTGDTSFLTTADLRVIGSDMDHVFKAGSSIVVNMTLTLTAGDSMDFGFDTAKANSRFCIRTMDGASIADNYAETSAGLRTVSFDPAAGNKNINIVAEIEDELGGYDIKWVNVTLESDGSTLLGNTSMSKASGTSTSLVSVYKKAWSYSGFPNGRYNFTIWLSDNSGHNHYYHLQMYVWDNYTSESSSYFTVGRMVYANVKAIDSKDMPLVGATILVNMTDTSIIVASGKTDASGMQNFTTIFTGDYDILVLWNGIIVANVTQSISDNVTSADPIVIDCGVYYPIFKIVDSKGADLSDASVVVRYPNGTRTFVPYRSNASGEFNITQAATGYYRLDVLWMDVLVNSTGMSITSNDTIKVFTAVFHLSTMVADSKGKAIAGAQVILANTTSGIVFDSKITNLSGGYGFKLPGGDYDIQVFWQNTLIYSQTKYLLDDNIAVVLVGAIYYLAIDVVDTHGIPVDSAQVVVLGTDDNVLDSNFTDTLGKIDSRLPVGTHEVQVYWMGVLTNQTHVSFSDDSQVTIVARIYYPVLFIQDADGKTLENARVDVILNETGEVLSSVTTDAKGEAVLRLPAAIYDLMVDWKGVRVYNERAYAVLMDDEREIKTSVYNLELIAVDSQDVPLKDALITLTLALDGRVMAGVTTDINGSAIARLPGAVYDLTVRWENVLVYEENGMDVSVSGKHILRSSVYYLDGRALDSRGAGLPGALVLLWGGKLDASKSLLSSQDGSFGLRLPVGTYNVSVQWRGRIVNETQGIETSSDLMIDFACSVYYLDLDPVDSKGALLTDASVTMISATSGLSASNGTTGPSSAPAGITLRLPGDTYDITVRWMQVLVNRSTGLVLDRDIELTMACSVYYLVLLVLDDADKLVQDATVDIAISGNVVGPSETKITDNTGMALVRLPGALYDINVSWHNIVVFGETARPLDSDGTWTLKTSIFYPEFVLKDPRNVVLSGAHMNIYLKTDGSLIGSSNVTDAGTAVHRLPSGQYRAECTWLGHTVFDETVTISSGAKVPITVKVFYMEPKVVDSRGLAVEDTIVEATEPGTAILLGSDLTGSDGKATIRLPIGSYDVDYTWRGRKVLSEDSIALNADLARDVKVGVYYLKFTVKDDRQVPLENARVEILVTKMSFESGVTGASGDVEFRLPTATYDAQVIWQTVDVGTASAIVLDRDISSPVAANVHYLTVVVKASDGTKFKGALVTVLRNGVTLFGAAQVGKDGRIDFRLPGGPYTIKVRYSTTYYMSGYSRTLSRNLDLTTTVEQTFVFKDYPPAIYTTNAFAIAILIILLILALVIVAVLLLKKPRRKPKKTNR